MWIKVDLQRFTPQLFWFISLCIMWFVCVHLVFWSPRARGKSVVALILCFDELQFMYLDFPTLISHSIETLSTIQGYRGDQWYEDRPFLLRFLNLQMSPENASSPEKTMVYTTVSCQIKSEPSDAFSRSNRGHQLLWLILMPHVSHWLRPMVSARMWSVWSSTSINEISSNASPFFWFS